MRTRSGRSEKLANERLMLAGPVNVCGFPSLPVELLLEVTSHLVRVPIPSYKQSVYDARYLAHHNTLRSLSPHFLAPRLAMHRSLRQQVDRKRAGFRP